MGKQKSIRRNFYLITFLQFFATELVGTTLMIYFIFRGMNAYQGNIIIAVFALTVFIMETPTGIIADLFGRRTSVVMGMTINIAAYFINATNSNFNMFIISSVMLGTAYTLNSGALEAWAVDYIKYEDKDAELGDLFSRVFAIRNAAGIFSGILGAFLATIQRNLPFFWSMGLFSGLTIFTMIVMKEPYFKKKVKSSNPMSSTLKSVGEIVRDSVEYGFKDKGMLVMMIIGMLIAFSNAAGNAFQQHRLVGLAGTEVWIVGVIKACYSGFMVFGAYLAGKLNKRFRMDQVMGIACFMIGFWLILGGVFNTFWSVLVVFFIYEIGRGMFNPAKQTYINSRIDGDKRATILSFSSALYQFGMVMGLLVTGRMNRAFNSLGADQRMIRIAWVICGSIAIGASLVSFMGLRERTENIEVAEKAVN